MADVSSQVAVAVVVVADVRTIPVGANINDVEADTVLYEDECVDARTYPKILKS
jgi:hypothetical protein